MQLTRTIHNYYNNNPSPLSPRSRVEDEYSFDLISYLSHTIQKTNPYNEVYHASFNIVSTPIMPFLLLKESKNISLVLDSPSW